MPDQYHINKNVAHGFTYGIFLGIGSAGTVYGLGIKARLLLFCY